MKRREKEKAGKPHTPSKRDTAPNKTINWKSPTFWPVIEATAREQVGKANNLKLVETLRDKDRRFQRLGHQRIGEWRDNSVKDTFVWSKETIAAVKKEFLPGGHQTRYNVFVSAFE